MADLGLFNINNFKNYMGKDGARPNLFQVALNIPGDFLASPTLSFTAKAATLPSSIVGTAVQPFFGRMVKFPGDRQFQPWSIQVVNDENFVVRDALERWSAKLNHNVQNVRDGGYISATDYAADGIVTQFSKTGTPIKVYKFIGMFPSFIGDIPLNWGQNDTIEEFPVTFEYQYWETATLDSIGGVAGVLGV